MYQKYIFRCPGPPKTSSPPLPPVKSKSESNIAFNVTRHVRW